MIRKLALRVLSGKIAFSTFVQLFGKAIQLVIATVTLKLISNYLTQGEYGIYATISEYALFFSVVANLGIFANTVREMSKAPRDGKVFFNVLVLRLVTAGLFFAGAIFYLVFNGADAIFITGTVLFLGALFFDYVTSVCDGMLQANYLMGRAVVALMAGRIVNLGVIFWIVNNLSQGADGAHIPLVFLAVLCGGLVTAGLSLFFVYRRVKWSFVLDGNFMKRIFLISLPFGIINILNNLYFRFLPDLFARGILTDEQFATFNISFKIAQVLSLFSTFLMFSVLPGFKQYLVTGDLQKARVLYCKIWKLLAGAGLALVVLGSLLGPFMLELLTHKKYFLPEMWFVLPMMLVVAAVSYFYDLVLITLFAFEEEKRFLKREFLALAFAGIVFAVAVLLINDLQLKIAITIAGAITGEGFMVVAGVKQIRKSFTD